MGYTRHGTIHNTLEERGVWYTIRKQFNSPSLWFLHSNIPLFNFHVQRTPQFPSGYALLFSALVLINQRWHSVNNAVH